MLDAGYEIRDTRYEMLDVGCWMLDVGCWMLDGDASGPNAVDVPDMPRQRVWFSTAQSGVCAVEVPINRSS
jgi:hypothetical protein